MAKTANRPFKGENGDALRRGVGRRIDHLCIDHGLSQQDVAAACGITPWAVHRYVVGKAVPRYEILLRLRQLFSTTLDYLLLGERFHEIKDVRLLRRLSAIDALPPEHKLGLLRLLDTYLTTCEAQPAAGSSLWAP